MSDKSEELAERVEALVLIENAYTESLAAVPAISAALQAGGYRLNGRLAFSLMHLAAVIFHAAAKRTSVGLACDDFTTFAHRAYHNISGAGDEHVELQPPAGRPA